jgi:hypothetical protein
MKWNCRDLSRLNTTDNASPGQGPPKQTARVIKVILLRQQSGFIAYSRNRERLSVVGNLLQMRDTRIYGGSQLRLSALTASRGMRISTNKTQRDFARTQSSTVNHRRRGSDIAKLLLALVVDLSNASKPLYPFCF